MRRRSRGRLRRRSRRRLRRRSRGRGLRGRLLLGRLRAQLRQAGSAKIYRHRAATDEPEDPHASIPLHVALSPLASLAVSSLAVASLPIRLTHRNYSTRQNHDRRQLSQHFSGSSRRATTSVASYRCDVWAQFSTTRRKAQPSENADHRRDAGTQSSEGKNNARSTRRGQRLTAFPAAARINSGYPG